MINAQPSESLSTDLHSSFDTDDGLSRAVAFRDFKKKVADRDRIPVLTRLLKKSLSASKPDLVASTVLAYLAAEKIEPDDELKALMLPCVRSSHFPTRAAYLNFLVNHNKHSDAPAIIAFMADENDSIRQRALDYVIRFDDGKKKISEYITKHDGDSAYEKSIARAKQLLQSP